MSYQDKNLTCSDCRETFVFTSGEQAFHAEKGFSNQPGRCPSCRAARKANGGNGGGSSRPSSGYSSSGRDFGRREMYDVICAECNRPTQVPFAPSNSRPVYCRDCFSKQGGGRSQAGGRSYRY